MPGVDPASILIGGVCLIAGALVGWAAGQRRSKAEVATINESWQAQLDTRSREEERLVEQNKGLMEQVNQLQDASREASNRSRDFSESLKEALERRNELREQISNIRSNLESVIGEKQRLSQDLSLTRTTEANATAALAEKDAQIRKLKSALQNWHARLPPLVERFRERDEAAQRLEIDLAEAEERIRGLEELLGSEQTRVEPIGPGDLPGSIDASNEPVEPEADLDGHQNLDGAASDEPDSGKPAASVAHDADESEALPAGNNDVVAAAAANGKVYAGGLRDNLRAIKGIGPAIEKTLNELGIFRFSQIAAMNRYDIERVANRLKGFQSRIEREDWIGQARELAEIAEVVDSGDANLQAP